MFIAGYSVEDGKTVASIGNVPEAGYTSKLSATALNGAPVGIYGAGWRTEALLEETKVLYAATLEELKRRGKVLVEDPFAGSGFADLADNSGGHDGRGMESVVYDMEQFLRRFGDAAAVNSVASLKAKVKIDPFSKDGPGGIIADMPLLQKSLQDPTQPPDLSQFLAARRAYLKTFNAGLAKHNLDVLTFPQTAADLPPVTGKNLYPATTVSEINIAGLPGIAVPAGQYASGAPFSLIFIGPMWSESTLLGYCFDYEQATGQRIVPQLVEVPFE
jgi:Asp-tRNA(Asn)/Glu-tRNA(Gln) amidotransferase A subunit family amidase